jgi:O-antigen/teichoic acid export membrane protein
LKKFLKNWSILTVSNILQQGMGFLVLIRITRLLGPQNFGEYTIILTVTSIAQIVATLGLRQIVIREIARNEKLIRQIAIKIFKYLGLAFIMTAFLIDTYLKFIEKLDVILVIFAIIVLLSQILWNFLEAFSFGRQEMQYSAIIGLIGSVLWIMTIYIIPFANFTLLLVMALFVCYQIFQAVAFLFIEWKNNYFKVSKENFNKVNPIELLKQSMAPYGTILLTLPITQIPILLLGTFSGKAAVAYYGIGNKLIVPITVVATNLLSAIYPILSKDFATNKDLFQKNGRRFFWGISLLGLLVTISLSLFSSEIVPLLFGDKYIPAIYSFAIQVMVALNLILHSYLGTIFLSTNNERLMVKLSVFNALIIGSINFVGAHYGSTGLAFSTWCGLIIGFSFHWYFINKYQLIKIQIFNIIGFGTLYVILSLIPMIIPNIGIAFKILIIITLFFFIFKIINTKYPQKLFKLLSLSKIAVP